MPHSAYTARQLSHSIGVGYKPQHFPILIEGTRDVAWLEIHAENYMGDGGRPLAQLGALRKHYDLSVHGVGLSIGGETALDQTHLDRLKRLIDRTEPTQFSEHLAWSTHDAEFFNDLLPLPYTDETLDRVCTHITQTQEALGLRMLLENPSSYLHFDESTWTEPDFLRAVSRETGCGLLLDVNNVFVSAVNLGFSPTEYIDAFPLDKVGEVHLGGHDEDEDDHGAVLLIDAHGSPVADPVWALLDYTLERMGTAPILIEWDNNVPEWDALAQEARRAHAALQKVSASHAA